MVTYLNSLNYNREVTLNKKKVVLLFTAPFCLACHELLPSYEKWAEEYSEDYDFKLIDITKNRFLTKKYDVVTTLTFIIIEDKKIVKRFAGMQTGETFKYFLEKIS